MSILALDKRKYILEDLLVDYRYTRVYTIINEVIISKIYKKLKIEPLLLSILKSLREYNSKLSKKLITYFILPILIINRYYKNIYPILITPL